MRQFAKTRFARQLRRDMTDAERRLWQRVRMRQMMGARFRRQHPLGPYIVDFACLAERLVIELDGGQHFESLYDRRRDSAIAAMGFRVLRFWNNEVFLDLDAVCDRISDHIRGCSRTR